MHKTAYEMRISDWSSDVCSSDLVRTAVVADEDHLPRLLGLHAHAQQAAAQRGALGARQCLGAAYPWRDGGQFGRQAFDLAAEQRADLAVGVLADDPVLAVDRKATKRSEERRVGKEGGR